MLKFLGESVHARFFRALSYKLFHISNRRSMQEHLRLLNWLEDSYEVIDAIVYVRPNRVGYLVVLIYVATTTEQVSK